MFGFLDMVGTYEERKVNRYEKDGIIVSTCSVTDSDKPYETGVLHESYNHGKWVIVELYDTKEESVIGHQKWVDLMVNNPPDTLTDVSTADVALGRKLIFEKKS